MHFGNFDAQAMDFFEEAEEPLEYEEEQRPEAEMAKSAATRSAQQREEIIKRELQVRQMWKSVMGTAAGLSAEIAKMHATQEALRRLEEYEAANKKGRHHHGRGGDKDKERQQPSPFAALSTNGGNASAGCIALAATAANSYELAGSPAHAGAPAGGYAYASAEGGQQHACAGQHADHGAGSSLAHAHAAHPGGQPPQAQQQHAAAAAQQQQQQQQHAGGPSSSSADPAGDGADASADGGTAESSGEESNFVAAAVNWVKGMVTPLTPQKSGERTPASSGSTRAKTQPKLESPALETVKSLPVTPRLSTASIPPRPTPDIIIPKNMVTPALISAIAPAQPSRLRSDSLHTPKSDPTHDPIPSRPASLAELRA